MKPLSLSSLLNWIFSEYYYNNSIFGIHKDFFYYPKTSKKYLIFNKLLTTPIGPAAGPHTQLAQNIISAYLTGGRFFELKTVQILDELEISRPCIDAEDECYNVEWSQELKIEQSFDEYLKAYLLVNLLKIIFKLDDSDLDGFLFNLSVGYELKGIKDSKVDNFIEKSKNLSNQKLFIQYKNEIFKFLEEKYQKIYHKFNQNIKILDIIEKINNIKPEISNSVTLSTMHGCPADEIEQIAKYLIQEKKLNTLIKLNPTLLGYEKVKEILHKTGFRYLQLDKNDFEHDLKYDKALEIIKNVNSEAKENKLFFGVKLTNTLPVFNYKKRLPEEKMYMSGKGLFYLSYELLKKLKIDVKENIIFSYSGGVTKENVLSIFAEGAFPITLATDLLKPGGYIRLKEIAEQFENKLDSEIKNVDFKLLKKYEKVEKKLTEKLPLFDCYIAPCQYTCPISQNVPLYIELLREGKYKEAFEVITEDNPLPNITSYICDHKCQFNCTLKEYGSSVEIRELKKIATEKGFDWKQNKFEVKSDKKVAIIGAGPAGLSAAYFLVKNGIKAKVFEKESLAGGTVKYTIPEFRINPNLIQKDVDFIQSFGVEFEFNVKEIDITNLKKEGYDYIFISIGAHKPKLINLGGKENIYDALNFLQKYNKRNVSNIGKNVAVIGGGNSAMDSARAAKKIPGVENVYLIYRRTVDLMPADLEEFEAAISEGVIYKELLSPVEFKDDKLVLQKMEITNNLENGRVAVKAIENETETLNIDTVILAIGEEVDDNFLKLNKLGIDNKTIYTNIPNVYVGGDARRGPSTVVEAIQDGKNFAFEILRKENIEITRKQYNFNFEDYNYEEIIKDRKLNYSKNTIENQCLLCNIVCNRCVDVCPNRANVAIRVAGFKDKYQIVHIADLCNDCGNCETFCPHNGAPYKEKLTYFSTKDDFEKSNNPGFYIENERIILRSQDQNKAMIVANEFTKWVKNRF
jgi:putative selenate reductase